MFSRAAFVLVVAVGLVSCTRSPADAEVATLASGDQVKVVEVVKGDEVIVEKDGRRAHLRLLGVHAVEAVIEDPAIAALSRQAPTYLSINALDQTVEVTLDEPIKDPLGRYLGYLSLRGQDLSRALIEQGLALAYTEFPHAREADYLAADAVIRAAPRGLWADPSAEKMIRGLRRVWAESRQARTHQPFSDPLLAPPAP